MPKRARLFLHERNLSRSGYSSIAGVDEAGRGPLAGPVVAGAVIIRNFKFKERIDDSKKLTAKKREKAYREILSKAIVGVGIVNEKTIDDINIYQATKKAMRIAISKLEIPPDYVIVDGNMRIATECPIKCIIGGDSKSFSIAAASIVAKVTRDRLMVKYDKVYPQYGFARHKGYGTKAHIKALNNHGPSPIHRNTFHPVKDLI
jgi:ribonuclease HII